MTQGLGAHPVHTEDSECPSLSEKKANLRETKADEYGKVVWGHRGRDGMQAEGLDFIRWPRQEVIFAKDCF